MNKIRVLFVCIHNSARSQMAEAFLNSYAKDKFEAESAGFEPKEINPLVIKSMQEIGIDISKKKSQSVFEIFKDGKRFHYVITVCDEASAEKCPIFPGVVKRLHWNFKDPSTLKGSNEEQTEELRKIRDEIKKYIMDFVDNYKKYLKEIEKEAI